MRFLACLLIIISIACSAEKIEEHTPTGTECVKTSTLSYANFGKPFLDRYCTTCHSTSLSGDARQGAPSDFNFNTLEALHANETEHLDHVAGAGANIVNTEMPPEDYSPKPTHAERHQLSEWIACGAP